MKLKIETSLRGQQEGLIWYQNESLFTFNSICGMNRYFDCKK